VLGVTGRQAKQCMERDRLLCTVSVVNSGFAEVDFQWIRDYENKR
jgi:hypothetical protein